MPIAYLDGPLHVAGTASISEPAYRSGLPGEAIDMRAGSLKNCSTSTKVSAEYDAAQWVAVRVLLGATCPSHDLLQSWHCLEHLSRTMRCQFERDLERHCA